LALVCVEFETVPLDEWRGRRYATALFEFRKGHWCVDGTSLDEVRPDEAVGRDQSFEAIVVTHPISRRVG
jgi:hypothetical protein